jgi:ParB family transcriptional regulator, chromosome partitioning protein
MKQLGSNVQIPCDLITPSPYQARRYFPEDYIRELASSIQSEGRNLQAITVREKKIGEGYELVAGECRLRATMLAGFDVINATIEELSDEDAHRICLIENIKRKDLNPIEEAEGIVAYMEEWRLTQEQAAERFNISRSKLANRVRLLNLHQEVKEMVLYGELEEGAARAILPLKDFQQVQLARKAVAFSWSVREVEAAVRKVKAGLEAEPATREFSDVDISRYAETLSEITGTPIKINHKKGGKGEIVITYFSPSQLEGLFDGFGGKR